jgi:putative transposase
MGYRVFIPDGTKALIKKGQRSATAAYVLNYHFVFRTKWNKKEFKDDTRAGMMVETLTAICEDKGYLLLGIAVPPEHVHIIVSVLPDVAPAVAARYLKGVSARKFNKAYGRSGPLWSDGYAVEAAGKKNVYQLLTYLARQDIHHGMLPGKMLTGDEG